MGCVLEVTRCENRWGGRPREQGSVFPPSMGAGRGNGRTPPHESSSRIHTWSRELEEGEEEVAVEGTPREGHL